MRVPHTWNIGKYDDYEGVAWYFRTLALSPAVRGQHVELHFAATFYKSRVWLNGKLLGAHEGGHTPYWFDISSSFRPGNNFLAVELDNRPTAQTIPGLALRLREGHRIWYDWWHYGGLVRDVWLTINLDGLIRRQRITSTVVGREAQVANTVFFENVSRGKSDFQVVATVYSPGGEVVGKPETTIITTNQAPPQPESTSPSRARNCGISTTLSSIGWSWNFATRTGGSSIHTRTTLGCEPSKSATVICFLTANRCA